MPNPIAFASAFYKPYQVEAIENKQQESAAAAGLDDAAIVYERAKHGSYADFRRSPDYDAQRAQILVCVKFLSEFSRQACPRDSQRIHADLSTFANRLHSGFFDTEGEAVSTEGVRSLHQFCKLIASPDIPKSVRAAAVFNLSSGLVVCAGGATANLAGAAQDLAMSSRGLCAAVWQCKQQVIEQTLRQCAQIMFGSQANFEGNEIHYVSALWNYIAPSMGLQPRADNFAPQRWPVDILHRCQAMVRRNLTPERCARALAEKLVSAFHANLHPLPQAGQWSAETATKVDDALEIATQSLGLQVRPRLRSLVSIDEDGNYSIRKDATLVAVDILKAMKKQKLLSGEPECRGSWQSEDKTQRVSVFTACGDGELAWAVRESWGSAQRRGWSKQVQAGLLTLDELEHWDGGQPSKAAVRQAAETTDPASLARMPPNWLNDAQAAARFLQRLDAPSTDAYVGTHADTLRAGITEPVRATFADHLMGRGSHASALVADWYPDAGELMAHKRSPKDQTRLERWMRDGNLPAIDAVGVGRDGQRQLVTDFRRQIPPLLDTLQGDKASPIVHEAMRRGDAESLRAWHRLFVADPTVVHSLGLHIGDLVQATSADGTPALFTGLKNGHAEAIAALHEIMVDERIAPNIRKILPVLLAAKDPTGKTGLYAAMEQGHARSVRAFHDMLADERIQPHIQDHLPILLAAQDAAQRHGLAHAMERGNAEVIRAYHQMLADPRITPTIGMHLASLLRAKSPGAQSALACAMMNGKLQAIEAFHEMVADDRISPHIQHRLSALLAAKTSDGSNALAYAMQRNQAEVVDAYHHMLADPRIAPLVRNDLPELLQAKQAGTSALHWAMREGAAHAVQAFHRMLADAQIGQHIGHRLPELLAAASGSSAPGLYAAMESGHAQVVRAFHQMLADDQLAPHIRDRLPDLVQGNYKTDPALNAARRNGRDDALRAYFEMLDDPRIPWRIEAGSSAQA